MWCDYCKKWTQNEYYCDSCNAGIQAFVGKKFKKGSMVQTELGIGEVVSIDLPYSRAFRYNIRIKNPTKKLSILEETGMACFFEKELTGFKE